MKSILKPRQVGGLVQAWQSQDRSFHDLFLKLNLKCEPENYPGVLIVSDVDHHHTLVASVESLQKELPVLLKQIEGEKVAYWKLERNCQKRTKILSDLAAHPVFVG